MNESIYHYVDTYHNPSTHLIISSFEKSTFRFTVDSLQYIYTYSASTGVLLSSVVKESGNVVFKMILDQTTPFYYTWWFISLLIGAIVGGAVCFYVLLKRKRQSTNKRSIK
ncbi:MAG: hypothetical protein ACTSUE_20580 [Promethearchaeota archaeon]